MKFRIYGLIRRRPDLPGELMYRSGPIPTIGEARRALAHVRERGNPLLSYGIAKPGTQIRRIRKDTRRV